MDDGTRLLRAALHEDWGTLAALIAEGERHGRGTPVAIVGFAFAIAIKRRFGGRRDLGEVIRFVAEARAALLNGGNLPPREAEALVCVNLDMNEPWAEDIVGRLDVGTITLYEGQLLYWFVKDAGLTDEQIDDLLREAEREVAEWPDHA